MGTLDISAANYFSSLNPIAEKIWKEHKNVMNQCGDKWDSFSKQEQDELLDRHFIKPLLVDKYAHLHNPDEEEMPECFPRLKIQCGEKIVLDFDNEGDGWSWRDEHSGPFSWETRSMQDLDLISDDDDETQNKSTPKTTEKTPEDIPKRPKRTKKSPTPQTDGEGKSEFAFKPEKSIWDSPFLAADRGLDSGYPSSENSERMQPVEETDELFQKFGIKMSFNEEKEDDQLQIERPAPGEETRLLASLEEADLHQELDEARSQREPSPYDNIVGNHDEETCLAHGQNQNRSGIGGLRLKSPSRDVKEAEESLIAELSSSLAGRSGHVSPVFIPDQGETDDFSTAEVSYQVSAGASTRSSVVDAQLPSPTSVGDAPLPSPDVVEDDEKPPVLLSSDEDLMSKSGFDFLDNW